MALIIPAASSTYADSTSTGGGSSRMYVLAQFRSDAQLEWVRELRALLVRDELKYENFRSERPRLMSRRELWRRIEGGLGQASIIVIDPRPVIETVERRLQQEQAQPGIDYGDRELIDATASALVAGIPTAYLPNDLVRAMPLYDFTEVEDLYGFAPDEIRAEIGFSLRDAKVFAARAHALFDLREADRTVATTRDDTRSPLAPVLMLELLTTTRNFDVEHRASLGVLNHAAEQIAHAMESEVALAGC